jgi:hypothetical protein
MPAGDVVRAAVRSGITPSTVAPRRQLNSRYWSGSIVPSSSILVLFEFDRLYSSTIITSPVVFSKRCCIKFLGTCFVRAGFGGRRSPVASPNAAPKLF